MLWTIIAIAMVLYSDDIPEVTLDLYWAIISIWIKLIDNLINVPGIQKNLIDAYHASEGYRIYLYQNVYFLGPWLFFVILCYLCYDMYIECVNLLFYLFILKKENLFIIIFLFNIQSFVHVLTFHFSTPWSHS